MGNSTLEGEIGQKSLDERTDRELVISQILLQREQLKRTNSILNYVQFTFWLFMFCLFVSGLIYFSMEAG